MLFEVIEGNKNSKKKWLFLNIFETHSDIKILQHGSLHIDIIYNTKFVWMKLKHNCKFYRKSKTLECEQFSFHNYDTQMQTLKI